MDTRLLRGWLIFAVGTALCGFWTYAWVAPFSETGSGGIGAVSAGPGEAFAALIALYLPYLLTFRLTKTSIAHGMGTVLRWSHVFATIAMAVVIATLTMQSFIALGLFLPMQVFFVNAALSLSIARPRA